VPDWTLEFVNENAVTVWENGQPITTGHGQGRPGALLDAWTTLLGMKRQELADWVGRKYRVLTGRDPEWPKG
jgi:hypothetical protein